MLCEDHMALHCAESNQIHVHSTHMQQTPNAIMELFETRRNELSLFRNLWETNLFVFFSKFPQQHVRLNKTLNSGSLFRFFVESLT